MATAELTSAKVKRLLTEAMGLRVVPSAGALCVDFTDASTSVRITVRDWLSGLDGEAQTVVVIEALVLQGVQPSADLYEWVAREGGSTPFGHVEVRDDPGRPGALCLVMTHTLLGDYLDQKELETALWSVLFAADSRDEALQRRFGGMRAKETRRQARA